VRLSRREELSTYNAAAMTAWVRFSPPNFGLRNWYILRHMTADHKDYPDQSLSEESRDDTLWFLFLSSRRFSG
jgi:hypothetical protein